MQNIFGICLLEVRFVNKTCYVFIKQLKFTPPPSPLDNVEWWLIKHQLVSSVMQTSRQSDRQTDKQTDKQTAKSQIYWFAIYITQHCPGGGEGGGVLSNPKPTIIYVFKKIIKFQTITHLIVCKMGEKKILGRLACLLVLDCVTLFRRDGGVLLTFSYIKKCHFCTQISKIPNYFAHYCVKNR